jgi:hypothetical protein
MSLGPSTNTVYSFRLSTGGNCDQRLATSWYLPTVETEDCVPNRLDTCVIERSGPELLGVHLDVANIEMHVSVLSTISVKDDVCLLLCCPVDVSAFTPDRLPHIKHVRAC